MSWASRVAEMPNSFVRGAHLRTRRPEYFSWKHKKSDRVIAPKE